MRKPHSWALNLTASCVVSSLSLLSLAFRTSVLLRLLVDLDTYGGVDLLGVFPLFLKNVVDIISPKLSIVFRRLIRLGSFAEWRRSANVSAITNVAPSHDIVNYRHINNRHSV